MGINNKKIHKASKLVKNDPLFDPFLLTFYNIYKREVHLHKEIFHNGKFKGKIAFVEIFKATLIVKTFIYLGSQ